MSLIFEINKLLVNLYEISKGMNETKIEFVKAKYESRKLAEQITDFNTILKFSERLELIKIENDCIIFLKHGKNLFDKITKNVSSVEKYSLVPNSTQIDFLKKIFFESKNIMDEFLQMINLFWIDEFQKKPTLTYILRKQEEFDKILMKFLQEIKIFELKNKKIICIDGLNEISKIKNKITTISEEELETRLEENKEIGKLGEQLTIKEEERRLRVDEKRTDLALDIKQVSITDVYAGFDLKSYDNLNSNLTKHDRMIEVKATRSLMPRFYWSMNEVNKAKELKEKYWIYLWLDVESNTRKLLRISNPYKKFFEESKYQPQCTGYFFDESIIENLKINHNM